MYSRNAEIKVGLLVIAASVALLGLVLYATQGDLFGDHRYLTLRFEPGNLAPRVGDPIQINGVKVGIVHSVDLRTETREGEELTKSDEAWVARLREDDPDAPSVVREMYVEVVAKLGSDIQCPVGTRGEIGESVTQTRYLVLIPGRSPRNLSDEDTRRDPIPVSEQPGLSSLAAKVESLADDVGDVAVTAEAALNDIRNLVQRISGQVGEGRIAAIFASVRDATAALDRTVSALEQDLAVIASDVKEGTKDFKRLTASTARLAERLEQDVPAAVADVRQLVAKVGGVVDRAAPKVDEFLDDVNRTGKNLVALSDGFSGVGDDARALVRELGADVDVLADTLIDTGRNLLDASEDLRAHPWKLLNEPSEDEIAYENLRNTMQNYVRAMQHMNATARTLQAILQRGDKESPTVRALIERTLLDFNRSVERYRSSESKLVELLQAGEGRPQPAPSRPR